MKKIIPITLFFIFTQNSLGASNDNIQLNSEITPACDVTFNSEPVAASLDLINSQSSLYVGKLTVLSNTCNSTIAHTNLALDVQGSLVHNVAGIPDFNFAALNLVTESDPTPFSVPFGSHNFTPALCNNWLDLYIDYTGVPAVSLVQGTYSRTWVATCSIELEN